MKIIVHLVEPEDERAVDIDMRDRRALERVGGKALGLAPGPFQESMAAQPESVLTWLAWHAAKRDGFDDDYDTWESRVVSIEQQAGADDADPT